MVDGFLGRWSERKRALRQGQAVDEAPQAAVGDPPVVVDPVPAPAPAAPPAPQAPSLADVQGLSQDSDFRPFVSRDVAPEVRNAAMKKLFADPHFGVMDRMDVYIDDYSQADPLPESMLRKMASASFLGLFKDEQQDAGPEPVKAQKTPEPDAPDDHTDLRLQPDHALEPPKPGRGTE